ncbi:uncharacterized protein V1513DRAFT_426011 [Lipomyces chichibuensis]|uniref:uncharacterized protein n=1 Tax=Lipomyces chichibuensis TaxID=1546026 RepID=UPI00334417DF
MNHSVSSAAARATASCASSHQCSGGYYQHSSYQRRWNSYRFGERHDRSNGIAQLTPDQTEHLILSFKESMRKYTRVRKELDYEMRQEFAVMNGSLSSDDLSRYERRRKKLQIDLGRAEAFVARYMSILSNFAIDTDSITVSAPPSRPMSPVTG